MAACSFPYSSCHGGCLVFFKKILCTFLWCGNISLEWRSPSTQELLMLSGKQNSEKAHFSFLPSTPHCVCRLGPTPLHTSAQDAASVSRTSCSPLGPCPTSTRQHGLAPPDTLCPPVHLIITTLEFFLCVPSMPSNSDKSLNKWLSEGLLCLTSGTFSNNQPCISFCPCVLPGSWCCSVSYF